MRNVRDSARSVLVLCEAEDSRVDGLPMKWFKELDRILRGEATRPDAIRDGTIDVPVRSMLIVVLCLAAFTGMCMGSFSLFKEIDESAVGSSVRLLQIFATTIKVPALFTLTLLVTFPSLYVFNALVGSRLEVVSLLRLLVVALAVNLAVLASLGPIVAFFSVSTRSYSFVVLLNVVVFSASGFLGILFLIQTLNRLTISLRQRDEGDDSKPDDADKGEQDPQEDSPVDQVVNAELIDDPAAIEGIEGQPLGKHVKLVFRCWMVIFGIVGAQMGWVLRPFIGAPNQPFEWFRARESNFFQAVWDTIVSLLLGG